MEFNLGTKNDCVDCKLESLSGDEVINVEYVQFRKSSVAKIADIMKNGVKRDNQELVIDTILCKSSEYQKLANKRYKATFIGLANIGNNMVTAIEFILANVDILFNACNVRYDADDVIIELANMTVYPYGTNSFRELDEK